MLGLSATGLYVVREAANVGVLVYGFSDTRETASSSRYLVNRGVKSVAELDQLEAQLERLASSNPLVCVIPTTDRHAEFLLDVKDKLSKNIVFAKAYCDGAARDCLDKARIAKIAMEAGLSIPWSHDLEKGWPESETLPFPLILKPKSIHHQRSWLKGRKLFVCDNEADIDQVKAIPQFKEQDWSLQALIDGPESNIYVAACLRLENGTTPVTFVGRKLRQYPSNFGSASLLISENNDEVLKTAHRLIAALGYHGIAGVEFKRDSKSGELFLIEINPRPCLWFSAATASGDLLIVEQLREWFGDLIKPVSVTKTQTVVWRYFLKDLVSRISHWRNKENGVLPTPEICLPRSRRRVWAVWSFRDPMPVFTEMGGYLQKAIARKGK